MKENLSLKEVLKLGKDLLEAKGVENAKGDALELINVVKPVSQTDILLNGKMTFSEDEVKRIEKLFELRAKRVPLQHILGKAYFYGREFKVNEDVLIPRFDTEILVEEVLKDVSKHSLEKIKIIDMCTGSGCIAISLGLESVNLDILGVDISKKALEVAELNKKDLKAKNVKFMESDLFTKVEGKFDILVSNPPYIDISELKNLSPEVADHDPHLALFAKDRGLYFYKAISCKARDYLNEKGKVFFEIGYNQAVDVMKIMEDNGYRDIRLIKDYGGNDRLIIGKI